MRLDYVRDVFQPRLEEMKKAYFQSHPDDPIILHRSELVRAKPPFSALENEHVRNEFNRELLKFIQSTEFTVIAVIIDKLEHNEGYVTWRYDPYHYCQEILIERYRLFLNIQRAVGDVMIESRGGKEDMRLKKSFKSIMINGTQYLKPNELAEAYTSKELKVKPKSANIAGLQLADLIAHPVRRWFFKHVFDLHDTHRTFSDEILETIEPKFFRYGTKIYGYGMKKLP